MPLRTLAQYESAVVPHQPDPWGARSGRRYSPQSPGRTQNVIHIPASSGNSQSHTGFSDFSTRGIDGSGAFSRTRSDAGTGSSRGDHSQHSFGPAAGTITISGIGGTITITPAGYGTNIAINTGSRTSAGVSPNANIGTQSRTVPDTSFGISSGAEYGPGPQATGDVGVITSDGNDFSSSSSVGGSDTGLHPSFGGGSDFNNGISIDAGSYSTSSSQGNPNPSSKFVAHPDPISGFIDTSSPNYNPATGSDPNPDINLSSDVISGPDQNLNYVSEPDYSSGASPETGFDSNTDPTFIGTVSTSLGASYEPGFGQTVNPGSDSRSNINSITSLFQHFGTDRNRKARVGASSGPGPSSGAGSGSSFGSSAGSSFGSGSRSGSGSGFVSGTGSGSGSGSGQPADASVPSTRKPFTSRYGPDFGLPPGHTRTKTCGTIVNLTIEYDLRLIPYNIPVVGEFEPRELQFCVSRVSALFYSRV